jgi:hypothetical protein
MAPIVHDEADEADEAEARTSMETGVGEACKMCERRMNFFCFSLALVCADVHINLLMIMS